MLLLSFRMKCFMPIIEENSVTAAELGKRIIRLLGLKTGEPFEIAKTRDGQVLVKKSEPAVGSIPSGS